MHPKQATLNLVDSGEFLSVCWCGESDTWAPMADSGYR